MDVPIPPRRTRSTAAAMFETLRDEIITLALPPGAVLSRPALQLRFGLSSTPVRDALLRLQDEGLVDVFPQHATVVSAIDVNQAQTGQFLRRAVEAEIARTLALQPDPALLERLRGFQRQQEAFAALGEHDLFTGADHAFHRAMYDAAGMGELWALVRRKGGHIDRLRRLNLSMAGKAAGIMRDHDAIVAAIAAGNPDAAQASVRDHLSRSLDFVDAIRLSHPEYFRP